MTSEKHVKILNTDIICDIYKYLFRASPRTQCTSIGNKNNASCIGENLCFVVIIKKQISNPMLCGKKQNFSVEYR